MDAHGGLDAWITGLGANSAVLGLVAALLLGLRHATDPDHVTAVATLVAGDRDGARGRAARLGLAWGIGHATTLIAFGLPVVLAGALLPDVIGRIAEFVIGMLIVALAVRLLVRWRRGYLHLHVHEHGGTRHAHVHMHERTAPVAGHSATAHRHEHAAALGRSPVEAFGVGLVHGIGGSAGAGVLLVAAAPNAAARVTSLVVFAAGTAISMAAMSALVGAAVGRGVHWLRPERLVPLVGMASGVFGLWYAAGAVR